MALPTHRNARVPAPPKDRGNAALATSTAGSPHAAKIAKLTSAVATAALVEHAANEPGPQTPAERLEWLKFHVALLERLQPESPQLTAYREEISWRGRVDSDISARNLRMAAERTARDALPEQQALHSALDRRDWLKEKLDVAVSESSDWFAYNDELKLLERAVNDLGDSLAQVTDALPPSPRDAEALCRCWASVRRGELRAETRRGDLQRLEQSKQVVDFSNHDGLVGAADASLAAMAERKAWLERTWGEPACRTAEYRFTIGLMASSREGTLNHLADSRNSDDSAIREIDEARGACNSDDGQSNADPQKVFSVGTSTDPASVVEPHPRLQPLTGASIAASFAGLGGWKEQELKEMLAKARDWTEACVADPGGGRGNRKLPKRWSPVAFGAALVREKHVPARLVRSRFQKQPELQPWLEYWKTYEADNFAD